MGEGGAVSIVHRPPLKTYAESFRDWGRDCWCASGKDDTCGKRFQWQLGELPKGYDHKYIYGHLGYNLKPLDPQAAIGRQQLKKLPAFIEARKRNWETLRTGLADLGEFFDFSLPTHATGWAQGGFTWDATGCRTDCSWFGFMLRVRDSAPFGNTALARHLESRKIGNRMLFGGNLLRQPAFVQLRKDRPSALRVAGSLSGADELMQRALFLGTYPGLTPAMLAYEIEVIRDFARSH
jgi:CDP-6-deoxy-D-xylo-4-hexulose-3-dehydrase